MKCSFPGCEFESETPQGIGRHQRYHIDAGEAEYVDTRPGLKTLRKIDNGKPPVNGKLLSCTLAGCSYHAPNAQGIAAHMRGHVFRGEATVEDGAYTLTGKPFAPTAKMKSPKAKKTSLAKSATKMVEIASQPLEEEYHSCSTTRAVDRMKDAIVMTTVAEMLDEVPADQMLMMLTQLRRLPTMPARAR